MTTMQNIYSVRLTNINANRACVYGYVFEVNVYNFPAYRLFVCEFV